MTRTNKDKLQRQILNMDNPWKQIEEQITQIINELFQLNPKSAVFHQSHSERKYKVNFMKESLKNFFKKRGTVS